MELCDITCNGPVFKKTHCIFLNCMSLTNKHVTASTIIVRPVSGVAI